MTAARFGVLGLVMAAATVAAPARADWTRLELVLDNGVRISTNEVPASRGPLDKKYPLRWMIDGDPRTAWVYEGDRAVVPEIRITVPGPARAGRLRIINGNAESRALYAANNRIAALTVGRAMHRLAETLRPQEIALGAAKGGSLVIRLSRLVPGARYDATSVSEIDLLSAGTSLLRARAHIRVGGGEYPTYALYRRDRLLAAFPPEAVMEASFIANGAYAVFVHPAEMHSPGVTVVNVGTGRKKRLLADLAIENATLQWADDRFVGRARDPRTDRAVPFTRRVRLP